MVLNSAQHENPARFVLLDMSPIFEFEFDFLESLALQGGDNTVQINPGKKKIRLDGWVECVDESEDSTDLIGINLRIIDDEGREAHARFQKKADLFFDGMFNNSGERIHRPDSAPSSWVEALDSNCILKNAKAMRDDRQYRVILVDQEKIEINIKYQYFTVDLALLRVRVPSIIVCIKGLFDSHGDSLPPLMYGIPIIDFIRFAGC